MAQRDTGFLENGPDPDCVLLLAIPAAPEVALVALSSLAVPHLIDGIEATMRTTGLIAPPLALHELNGNRLAAASRWEAGHDPALVRGDLSVGLLLHDLSVGQKAICVKYKVIYCANYNNPLDCT